LRRGRSRRKDVATTTRYGLYRGAVV